jgi:hypothetical protein
LAVTITMLSISSPRSTGAFSVAGCANVRIAPTILATWSSPPNARSHAAGTRSRR